MKRTIILTVLGIMAFGGLQAQDCEAIMLPFFHGDVQKMREYPAPKFEWRCKYSQNAFYLSDTVPEGAEMHALTELTDKLTGQKVSETMTIDLNTLSYYRYTFSQLQLSYPKGNVTICFPIQGAEHRYLVLRSLDDTYFRTEFPQNYQQTK